MFTIAILIKIVVTLGFIVVAYWVLQGLNWERVILKNHLQEFRIFVLLVAIVLGGSVASFVFSLAEQVSLLAQLLMGK